VLVAHAAEAVRNRQASKAVSWLMAFSCEAPSTGCDGQAEPPRDATSFSVADLDGEGEEAGNQHSAALTLCDCSTVLPGLRAGLFADWHSRSGPPDQ
jgi:hypothetical protein